MAEVRMGTTVSLDEATNMVQYAGDKVSFIFQGEMGMGKSAMLWELSRRMPEYRAVYAELQTMDVSDLGGIPYTEIINGVKVTRFAPNAFLNIQSDKPVLFMADELGKSPRPTQNSALRLLHEKKSGEYSLPEGSIVFATTNLAAEGLGDAIQAHALNRCSLVTVRKPNAAKWIPWAMANGIHPVLIAWVKRYPMCLDSYMDGKEGNPYIYYPGKTTKSFVTPRSLEKASHILWVQDKLGDNATQAGIAGAMGEAGARDLMSFVHTNHMLPAWDVICTQPDTCAAPPPEDFAACFISVFTAITLVERDTFTPWMTYCQRLPKEYQGVFALNVLTSPKRALALSNRAFVVWATDNHWMV